MVPMKWGANPSYSIFPVLVNIYAHDGSVTVHHGGVEMGQGINTKVEYIQYIVSCNYAVDVPMIVHTSHYKRVLILILTAKCKQ